MAGAPLDVLVVDDDAATRSALVRILRDLGHTCRAVESGAAALAAIAERRPEVIVSDLQMPGMSGVELCKRVRARPSPDDDAPYIYFILTTAGGSADDRRAGMAAGADDFQKKPMDLDELEARLVTAARVVRLHRTLADQTARLRRESRRLFVASRTDALTGVENRLALHDELVKLYGRATRYDHKYSLAVCDVDNFKAYNDAFGHVAGDAALTRVASTIRNTVRASDGVYRYGGEEFVILFPEQALADAAHATERVRLAVERLGIPAPDGGVLTISAGVAEVDPAGDRTPEEWLARADAALYGAKADGRNRVECMIARA